jgi:hypothetical protein
VVVVLISPPSLVVVVMTVVSSVVGVVCALMPVASIHRSNEMILLIVETTVSYARGLNDLSAQTGY